MGGKLMNVTLKRISSDPFRTFGVILIEGTPSYLTLERPWKKNKINISCIPEGKYKCVFYNSPSKGPSYLVKDVKNRSNILIHIGNLADETQGCILIGSEFGRLHGEPAVLGSGKAHYNFMTWANERDFDLTIE